MAEVKEEAKVETEEEATVEPATKPAEAEIKPTESVAAPAAPVTSNASGGLNGPFPAELSGWNWGAFLMSWIWAIGNSVWIGLLALIGPISLIVAIILGLKGNEWAWQHRKFENVEQFKKVQKTWAIWGLVLFIISLIIIPAILITVVFSNVNSAKEKAADAQKRALELRDEQNAALQNINSDVPDEFSVPSGE